jgi:hypothetical protein
MPLPSHLHSTPLPRMRVGALYDPMPEPWVPDAVLSASVEEHALDKAVRHKSRDSLIAVITGTIRQK